MFIVFIFSMVKKVDKTVNAKKCKKMQKRILTVFYNPVKVVIMFIRRSDYEAFKETARLLDQELQQLKKRPFLLDVERKGRINSFTFARGEEIYVVETMGLIGDNLPEWKEKLLR